MASKSSLSPEEEQKLQKELPTVLESQGVNNKSKAKYVKSISEFVIGSQNPKFFSMQPRVKDKSKIEEWKAAYLVVLNFLDEYKLDLTKDVLMKELEQNKVPKPPLPSVPPGYSSNDVNEIFNFDILFEVSNISDFNERVEYFVTNILHEEYHEPATEPASQSPVKTAAKPLNQNPVSSSGAFLTQPSAQQVQNNDPNKSIEENQDDEFIDDFNDDYDKEENDQDKANEKGGKKAEEDQDEIIDIEDINTDDENVDDKKETNEGDDENIEIDDFNDDDDDFINDDSNEGNKENKPEQKSESDTQNNSFSISMNSDMFDGI